jgi:hypothetical protein
MRTTARSLGITALATALVWLAASTATAQQRPAPQPATQRLQGTRDMHVACVGPDSGRTFRRSVGDSLNVTGQRMQTASDSNRITGGTPRSHEYPEYDVVLDIPNLCVERIFLKVDTVTAKISLDAKVSNLVHISAGADVFIGDVDLTIQDVRARALLLVDLDDVVHIVDQTLTFVDNHPEVVQQLTSTLANAGGAVGGLVGDVVSGVKGLLLSSTKMSNGNILQHVVDQATGSLIDKTMSAAGKLVAQKTVGNIMQLPTVSSTTNAAGQLVKQVKDQAGNLIEYTMDKAGKLSGVRSVKP